MKKTKLALPNFYSVQNFNSLRMALMKIKNQRCYIFFDNGFESKAINNHDQKFIWDGFLLFVPENISIEEIKNGKPLNEANIIALQRISAAISNNKYVREYIKKMLEGFKIPYEEYYDIKYCKGHAVKSSLYTPTEEIELYDYLEFYQNLKKDLSFEPEKNIEFTISFPKTKIPDLQYNYKGLFKVEDAQTSLTVCSLPDNLKTLNKIANNLRIEKSIPQNKGEYYYFLKAKTDSIRK